jgi:hypothetical protein
VRSVSEMPGKVALMKREKRQCNLALYKFVPMTIYSTKSLLLNSFTCADFNVLKKHI